MRLKEVKKGDYFTRKPIPYPKENQVFVKGEYSRSTGKYICFRFSDINDWIYLSPQREVFTDFIF